MKRSLLVLLLLLAASDLTPFAAQAPPTGPPQGRGAGQGRGQAPARDAREQAAGTAVIRGRIVSAENGTPIRRAQVRATSGAERARLVSTDADGRFEFRDLSAGRWNLTASKAGFVTLRYGQRRPFEAGRPIELAEKQVMDRADLALPRGAAITGRVFDEFGDPVAGARVQVMRYQLVQGTRRLTPAGGASQSDDTGAFRVFGLMPGDYYISATLRALQVDDPADATSYAPTYFPGTGSVQDAQRIPVLLGQEQSGINFALLPVRTVRVTGVAINSMGIPLAGGNVMLMPSDSLGGPLVFAGGGGGGGGRVGGGGRFTLSNVVPGSYTLLVTSGGGRQQNAEAEVGSLSLTVGSEDLENVTLITGRGATLSGTIATAPGVAATLAPNGIQVGVQQIGGTRGFPNRPGRANADGVFQVASLFGQGVIRVNGLPQGWAITSVMIGGTDVIDTPLDFKPNDEIRGVQILLTNQLTEVSGTARGSDGKPLVDYTVVVFADDETKWTSPSRYIWSTRPDLQGVYKIRGLPASGRYLAVAVDYLEEGEANDPEFLSQVRERAAPFSLADGESKTVGVTLVAR